MLAGSIRLYGKEGLMFNRLRYFIRDIPWKLKQVKFFYQRGRRGWADCDVWGMDYYLARVIPGMLKDLRKNHNGYPATLETDNEWVAIINKIIAGFEAHIRLTEMENWAIDSVTHLWTEEEKVKFRDLDSKDEATYKEGMALLTEWFGALWD